MPRPPSQHPTPVEAEILSVVWEKGPVTVRDVHDVVGKSRDNAYSSVATIMRIMTRKGLLRISDNRRPVRFDAAVKREDVGRGVMHDIVNRMFAGSVAEMLRHALSGRKRLGPELAEIKKVLKQFE